MQMHNSHLKVISRPGSASCSGCSGCCEMDGCRSATMSVQSFDQRSFSSSDKDVQSLFDSKVWDDLGYTPVPSPSPPAQVSMVSAPKCPPDCCECVNVLHKRTMLAPSARGPVLGRPPYSPYYPFASPPATGYSGVDPSSLSLMDVSQSSYREYRGAYETGYNGVCDPSYNSGRYYSEYARPNAPVQYDYRSYSPPTAAVPPRPLPPLAALPTPLPAPEWLSSNRVLSFVEPARSPPLIDLRVSPATTEETSSVPLEIDDSELPSFDCLMQQNLCKLAFRREGSMLLQKMLPKMAEFEKEMVLTELMGVLVSLSCNAYGNYVVQQLIDEVSFDQRRDIANVLGREIVALSMNIHGYCVVNKLIEEVCVETQIRLLDCVSSHIKEMCLHEYASQVVICFIVHMPPLFLHPITTTFCGRSWFFATHSTSHRVLTTLVDHATSTKRQELISEIANFVVQLSKDPVGNYVVQHALGLPPDCGPVGYIRMQLIENFYLLSLNKIASHVVEKLLQTSSRSELESAVEWVVNSSNKKLIKLINSPFGNYVMKTLTELANRGQRRRISGRVEPITTRVRCSPFLKHLRELQVM